MRLSELSVGERARVRALAAQGGIRRRLQELGFCPGAPVVCWLRAPMGDPVAYLLRGTVVALRGADADVVTVEALP